MRRLVLLVIPALSLTGLVFLVAVAAPWVLGAGLKQQPQQPVRFSHQVHVQAAGIPCEFCHRTAAQGVSAGYPDLEQCMFCHQAIGRGNPEIEKVRQAWITQQPLDWQRIHRMPDHVRFTHEAHVQAGIACAACHGDVASMTQDIQVRSLKMNDCVACHQQSNAPTQCGACHY